MFRYRELAASASYDRNRVMRIIMARCRDALTDHDINALMEPDLPTEIGEQLVAVLDLMMDTG